MIRVGDKFTGIDGREEVVTSIWLNDKTVGVESGLAYSYEEVYKSWYQQQKQRADELEKRWSELKEIISSKYNVINDASFKTILLFLTLLMKDLEENNNA